MKKSVIILWIAAALFLVSAFPMFSEGNVGAGVCGIVLAVVLAVVGYLKNKKAKQAAEEAARVQAEEEARKAAFAAAHGVLSLSVAGVTFDNDDGDGKSRQRILAALYKESEGVGVEGSLEEYEFKGERAVHVLAEDQCIGDIRKSDLPEVLPILERVESVSVYIDRFDDDGEKVYRADLRVQFAK